jgi:hypothetical protein
MVVYMKPCAGDVKLHGFTQLPPNGRLHRAKPGLDQKVSANEASRLMLHETAGTRSLRVCLIVCRSPLEDIEKQSSGK